MVPSDVAGRIDRASVGVLGYVTSSGAPNAVAVTPYVVVDRLAVTSTLALIDKAAALRRDPRVTLTAGGVAISGSAVVQVDRSARFFDRHLRRQELAKYPPSRSLLALPFHRRLLSWYVGRVVLWIEPDSIDEQPFADDTSLTVVDATGRLRTWCLPPLADLEADEIELPHAVANGAAVLLVHREDAALRDLRQLTIAGQVAGSVLRVEHRRGSLDATRRGALDELRQLRTLARRARANRHRLASWPPIEPMEGTAP